MNSFSYSHARAHLKTLIDDAVDSREPILIRRRGGHDVALIDADELRSLIETVHLLRSPANAERLLRALRRAKTKTGKPSSLLALKAKLALHES